MLEKATIESLSLNFPPTGTGIMVSHVCTTYQNKSLIGVYDDNEEQHEREDTAAREEK